MNRLIIVLLLLPAMVSAQDIAIGSMGLSGLEGQGTTLEVSKDLGLVTVGAIGHQRYSTSSSQSVESGVTPYATFNVVNTNKWTLGVGAAYVQYKTTDVHNFRALFGVPQVMGEISPIAPALMLNRRFGPMFVGFRYFAISTSGGWFDVDGASTLSFGVSF